jgi:hypothetical protein
MAQVTREQFIQLLKQVPQGTSPEQLRDKLIERGNTLVGYTPPDSLKVVQKSGLQRFGDAIKQTFQEAPKVFNPVEQVKAVAAPFAKYVASGTRAIQATPQVFGAVKNAITGDTEQAGKNIYKAQEIMSKPIGNTPTFSGSTVGENLLTTAEVASNLIGTKAKTGLNKVNSGVKKVVASQTVKKELKATERALEAVTPKVNELTITDYQDLLRQGKILPKTNTSPAQYVLSDAEKLVAQKYKGLIQSKDPVKNSINVMNEIVSKDVQVGKYLEKNNGIFNSGKLKNYILDKLENVTDISVDENRLIKVKQQLVDNFVSSLKKNDQLNLWKSRKAFDRQIEKAFSGSPTLQNNMKKELRNSVQDFISDSTDNVTYKGFMKDMSELFNLQDVIANKATKEKALSGIKLWIKNNPVKSKIVGWSIPAGIGTVIGSSLLGD